MNKLFFPHKILNRLKTSHLILIVSTAAVVISIFIFHDFIKVGYIFHDFDFFRDNAFLGYLNPKTGNRWQPEFTFFAYFFLKYFGLNPFWPKVFIFMLYLANFSLFFWLLLSLTRKKSLAFLAALAAIFFCRSASLVFVYDVGIIYVLFTTIFLLSLIFYNHYLSSKKTIYYLLALIIYPAMILTQEAGVVFPIVLLSMEYFFIQQFKLKQTILRVLPFFLISLSYVLILFSIKAGATDNLLLQKFDYHFVDMTELIKNIVKLIIGFSPLNIDYKLNMTDYYLISTTTILASLSFIIFSKNKLLKFFLVIPWLLALPYACFAVYGVQERYIYVGGLFSIAFLIFALWEILQKQLATKILFAIIIFIFIFWNLQSLEYRVGNWEKGAKIMSQLKNGLLTKYPDLPSHPGPVYISNVPNFVNDDSQVSLGNPGNFIHYIYGQSSPRLIYCFQDIKEVKNSYKLFAQENQDTIAPKPLGLNFTENGLEEINFAN